MPCTKLKHCQTLQVTKLQITIIDNYKFRNFPAFDNENRRKIGKKEVNFNTAWRAK